MNHYRQCGTDIGEKIREFFSKKRKSTGFVHVPGSKFRETGGHLSMRPCLQDAVINYAPRIGKYIDKL